MAPASCPRTMMSPPVVVPEASIFPMIRTPEYAPPPPPVIFVVAFAYPAAAETPLPPPRVIAPPFEIRFPAVSSRIPPRLVLSESDQRVIDPPLVVKVFPASTLAVAFRSIGAVALVLAVMFAPVLTSPPEAVTAIPPLPAEVSAPVPA